MVYESDFYTTRRPYRATPSLSTYTVSSEPSRQVRILPGLGKVHVVHSYDRIVPYVGHKRLTVVTTPPLVVRLRPSTLYREFDRIENKLRPYSSYSYTNDYLNSDSHVRIVYVRNPISSSYPVIYRPSTLHTTRYYPNYSSYYSYPSYLNYTPSNYFYSYYAPTRRFYSTYSYYPSERWYDLALYPSWRYNHFSRMFDDETRLIRAQTASLLHQIHNPVPRRVRPLPLPYVSRYDESPARWYNDNYIHKMLISSPSNKAEYTTYWSDPVRKFFGQGHLACVTMVGEKSHPRRRNVYVWQDPVKNDIQLLSYYINRFREEKSQNKAIKEISVTLSPIRPSRIFSVPRPLEDPKESEEMIQLKEERAARLAKISSLGDEADIKARAVQEKLKKEAVDKAKKAVDEAAKKEATDAAARKTKKAEESTRKEAEAKRQAEEEAKRKAEEDAKKQAEEEAKRIEEEAQRQAEEEANRLAEEEAKAREAAEKAAELERLAEQTRLEELAKQEEIEKAKKEEEERARLEEEKRAADAAKAEEERQQLLRLEEIARQAEEEKEAELARQAEELAELARQEAELAEKAKAEEELAEEQRKEAEKVELEKKEAELAELESKEKELNEQAEEARLEAEKLSSAIETPENTAEEVEGEPQAESEQVLESEDEKTLGNDAAQAEDGAGTTTEGETTAEEETEEEEEE